jgi:hypothetical protein
MGGKIASQQSSLRLRGAVVALKRLPRVRKERVPGANVLARLRRAPPGGLPGNLPRVERFVRHPGVESMRENAPRRWCKEYLGQQCSEGKGFIDSRLSAYEENSES